MEISKYSKVRKIILIAGLVIGLINLCIVFPGEYAKSSYITDFVLTYICLAISVFFVLYGFTGRKFFNYLLFMLLSAIIGAVCWFFVFYGELWQTLLMVWIGIPTGLLTALLFFPLRYYIFCRNSMLPIEKSKKRMRYLKQAILYFILLFVVSILFFYGGDWIDALLTMN